MLGRSFCVPMDARTQAVLFQADIKVFNSFFHHRMKEAKHFRVHYLSSMAIGNVSFLSISAPVAGVCYCDELSKQDYIEIISKSFLAVSSHQFYIL